MVTDRLSRTSTSLSARTIARSYQTNEKITVYDLKADSDEDAILVGWTDAAPANCVDLTSTGGYVIG